MANRLPGRLISPEKVVEVLSLPTVSVAEPKSMVPPPAREPKELVDVIWRKQCPGIETEVIALEYRGKIGQLHKMLS